MGVSASSLGAPTSTFTEARQAQRKFLCPACRQPTLAMVHDGGPDVVRCEECAWATDNLLALIPVRPAPLVEVAVGRGAVAAARILLFVAACAAVVALVIARG